MAAKKRDYWDYARYANMAFSFGVTMTAAILLGLYGGLWLDRRWGTSPLFLLLGVFLGIGVAFRSILSELRVLEKKAPGIKTDDQDKTHPD
ncbi:AtpZ/AtpI family protein [Moorella sulfitireducens]|uniref:AtpZ/AtpI family protein n=1 Tax=Neomoorella sulfitireducens TaxID=2972948 RepID=UPI0021ACF536|nr:AtpZ/AtpI family protein [Moorella sulfitireducens]